MAESVPRLRRRWVTASWPFFVALSTAYRAAPVATVAMLLVAVFFAVVPLTLYVTTSIFAGAVAEDAAAVNLAFWVPLLALLVFLLQCSDPVLRQLNGAIGRRIDQWAQRRVMTAALGPDTVEHLETPAFREAASLAQGWGAAAFPPADAVYSMLEVFRALLVATGSAALLVGFSWWVPLVLSSGFILMTVWGTRVRTSDEAAKAGTATARRRAEYLRDQAFDPASSREARVYGLGRWFGSRAHDAWLEALEPVWRARAGTRKTALLTIAVLIGSHLLVLGLIMSAAIDGHVSVTQAALYLQGAGGMVNFWFPWHVVALREATRPLVAINDLPVAAPTQRRATSTLPLRGDIVFAHVTFRYPGRSQPVFDGLDLRIAAGSSLAVVGANGAGKTTLVKLLAGLLDPDEGSVSVGEIDIRAARARWQREVAAIFQDFARYPFTARDNVMVGDPAPDPAAAARAIERALADHVVADLEGRLDAQLGRAFDGVDLSGGQWQRLALARALYAVERGARVLVLDEPTAQLDVRAEAALFDRYLELTRGVTTVLISHRFSSVRHAERIVVLDAGRVVEDGSHEELIAARGSYAQMFAEQARYFEVVDA